LTPNERNSVDSLSAWLWVPPRPDNPSSMTTPRGRCGVDAGATGGRTWRAFNGEFRNPTRIRESRVILPARLELHLPHTVQGNRGPEQEVEEGGEPGVVGQREHQKEDQVELQPLGEPQEIRRPCGLQAGQHPVGCAKQEKIEDENSYAAFGKCPQVGIVRGLLEPVERRIEPDEVADPDSEERVGGGDGHS